MYPIRSLVLLCTLYSFLLTSCASYSNSSYAPSVQKKKVTTTTTTVVKKPNYASRIPKYVDTGNQKAIIVYPSVHAWGAYGANGELIRAGLATSGSNWCPDIKRACRTKAGTFRIKSLGSFGCKSSIYPLPRGGAPMPYCMFFNGHQGLHGSYNVVDANASHGCVRLTVSDAEWVRFNFATIGTKVIVRPY